VIVLPYEEKLYDNITVFSYRRKAIINNKRVTKYSGLHCKPGKAYMHLKTATCEAGPGTTHMCSSEICMCSVIIHHFDDE
jgi:hypothetical protein